MPATVHPGYTSGIYRGPRALLVTGTVGSGKTSVADAIGDLLAETSVPGAVIDMDWLRRSWPTPPGDRFNLAMALRNLRSVARNYLDAGALRLVLAGVVETREERRHHQEAIGIDLALCRLRVDLAVVRQRLVRRHENDAASLEWYLHRSGELDAILDEAGAEDFAVNSTDGSVVQVARAVLSAAGWD